MRLGSTRNIHTKVPTPNTKECSSKEITAYIRTGPGSGWYAIRKGHTLECRDRGHDRRSTRMERRLRIYKSPQCQVFTIPLQTSSFPGLLGDHKSSLCSDPRAQRREISNVHNSTWCSTSRSTSLPNFSTSFSSWDATSSIKITNPARIQCQALSRNGSSQIRYCYQEDNKFFLTVCEEINSLNILRVSSVITS